MIFSLSKQCLYFALFATAASATTELRGSMVQEERDLSGSQQCTGCWPGTSGTCKQDNTVCYNPPAGSPCFGTPCGGGGSSSTSDPCTNTNLNGGKDQGCTSDEKICVYANGGLVFDPNAAGDHCSKCVNSKRGGGGRDARDFGCPKSKPVCVDNSGYDLAANVSIHVETCCFQPAIVYRTNQNTDTIPFIFLSLQVAGSECATCFNSLDSDNACDLDDGCPPSKPDCVNADGLTSPPLWMPGEKCRARCEDTADGLGVDKGCHGEYPVCVFCGSLAEPPQGRLGSCCSKCSKDTCDDGNECTEDICTIDGGCEHVPIDSEVCNLCPNGVRTVTFDNASGSNVNHGDYVGDFGFFSVEIKPNKNTAQLEAGSGSANPGNLARIYTVGEDGEDPDLEINPPAGTNLLIIQETYDGVGTDDIPGSDKPDDTAAGGHMKFTFTPAAGVVGVKVVDNEEQFTYKLKVNTAGGSNSIDMEEATTDGEITYTSVLMSDVESMVIKASGSFGVMAVDMCK